jgi:biopolymer transport protein ExbB
MGLGFLSALTQTGGGWVIWLLLLSSVGVVAVAVEKALVLKREAAAFAVLKAAVAASLSAGDVEKTRAAVQGLEGAAARILQAGLARPVPVDALEERLAAARLLEKKELDRRLLLLGTLGNNAPFIGLFGTVLGVIKAFQDLALSASAGPEVVMEGLAEALIATAVGLLVAIPAVIAYNAFQKVSADILTGTDALSRLLSAAVRERDGRRG